MWLFKKRTKELVQELVQDSIRYGDFKYIRKFSRNEEVLHPPKEALYNLAEDLQEQNNLLEDIDMRAKYKELKQKMRRQLTRLGQCPNDKKGSFELSGGGPNVGMSVSCDWFLKKTKKSKVFKWLGNYTAIQFAEGLGISAQYIMEKRNTCKKIENNIDL